MLPDSIYGGLWTRLDARLALLAPQAADSRMAAGEVPPCSGGSSGPVGGVTAEAVVAGTSSGSPAGAVALIFQYHLG